MFDLEKRIQEWRRQMAAGGLDAPKLLDELESHLRDDVEEQVRAGIEMEQAFGEATARIGHAEALENEFNKVDQKSSERKAPLPGFALAPATLQDQTTFMNKPCLNNEPWWATYAKGTGFLAPAILLWAFSALFLFPKVQQICQDAGMSNAALTDAVIFHKVMAFHGLMGLVAEHGTLVLAAILLVVGLLEWRSRGWPRYRRASIGAAVFLVNAAVLVLITSMFTLALVAAPALFHAK